MEQNIRRGKKKDRRVFHLVSTFIEHPHLFSALKFTFWDDPIVLQIIDQKIGTSEQLDKLWNKNNKDQNDNRRLKLEELIGYLKSPSNNLNRIIEWVPNYCNQNLLAVVDQVGHNQAKEGMKTIEDIMSIFAGCSLIMGTSFHSDNSTLGIFRSSNQDACKYLIYGDPFNKEEVIHYLQLYQESNEVDTEFVRLLLESSNKVEDLHTSSLWYRFREVTGFVPFSCWKVIRKKREIEEEGDEKIDQLFKILDNEHGKIIREVADQTYSFYSALKTKESATIVQGVGHSIPVKLSNIFRTFCSSARSNHFKSLRGVEVSIGGVINDQRLAWDLRHVSCGYNNEENQIHSPKALSTSIALGLLQVYSN